MKKIKYLVPYFGSWPPWIELYFHSIKLNPTIDFTFFTDCEVTFEVSPNVRIVKTSFEAYVEKFKAALGENINVTNPYKICDLRPFFGHVHKEEIEGYDFFGWTDVDIVYGNIRAFYTDELLTKYHVFSAHEDKLAGHSALLKNTKEYRDIGFKMYRWKEKLIDEMYYFMDESQLYFTLRDTFLDKVFDKLKWDKNTWYANYLRKLKNNRYYIKEQYSTPFIGVPWIDGTLYDAQPTDWIFDNGRLTNTRDGDRQFMYLHLMNFKSSKYRNNSIAPWEGRSDFYQVKDLSERIRIDSIGVYNADC